MKLMKKLRKQLGFKFSCDELTLRTAVSLGLVSLNQVLIKQSWPGSTHTERVDYDAKRNKYVVFDKGRTFAARVYETYKLEFSPEE